MTLCRKFDCSFSGMSITCLLERMSVGKKLRLGYSTAIDIRVTLCI